MEIVCNSLFNSSDIRAPQISVISPENVDLIFVLIQNLGRGGVTQKHVRVLRRIAKYTG